MANCGETPLNVAKDASLQTQYEDDFGRNLKADLHSLRATDPEFAKRWGIM